MADPPLPTTQPPRSPGEAGMTSSKRGSGGLERRNNDPRVTWLVRAWVCLRASLCSPMAPILPQPSTPKHIICHPSTCPGLPPSAQPPSSRLWCLPPFHLPLRPDLLLHSPWNPGSWPGAGFRDFPTVWGQPFLGQERHPVTSGERSEAPGSLEAFPAQCDKWRE